MKCTKKVCVLFAAKYHGYGGPLTIEKKRYSALYARQVVEAFQELGYGVIDEMLSHQIGNENCFYFSLQSTNKVIIQSIEKLYGVENFNYCILENSIEE